MKPYYEQDGIQLFLGDCREVLPALADCSVDSIVTDPPYELGFMGKSWDRSGIAYQVEVWRECLRVLKHGGHLLAFGGSRTYHRLACAIEDAGFEIRDQIQWLYGSGFPKSLDISKQIDARPGVTRHAEFAKELREAMIAKGITNSFDVAQMVVGKRSGAVANWLKYQWPEAKWWPALRDVLGMDCKWDDVIAEAGREKIGERGCGNNFVFYLQTERGRTVDVTKAATEAAKQWNGWGTALKPAHEPIVMARKPLDGTVAENVLKHGTGGINVDGCRVECDWQSERGETWLRSGNQATQDGAWQGPTLKREGSQVADRVSSLGRWPSNVILSYPEDEYVLRSNVSPEQKKELFKWLYENA